MSEILLSLCIPTYGVEEWVFPVIESIYRQGADETLFEVVITDNGKNENFAIKLRKYTAEHSNLVYKKTQSISFLNEIDSYRAASGKFIKFVNHRTVMLPGAIEKLLRFIRENEEQKPCVYFSNGVLKFRQTQRYDKFDDYVKNLSYFSSWSTGMAFWKEDFEKIPQDLAYNELFPHTGILFFERHKSQYIIDNDELLYELPVDSRSKGKYDLFYAFAVEYPAIIEDLLRSGDITTETFLEVKNQNLNFLAELYLDFVVLKRGCSYDLSSFANSVKVYYSKGKVRRRAYKLFFKKAFRKVFGRKNKQFEEVKTYYANKV